LQFEAYREGVPYVDWLTVHLAGDEIGEGFDYTYRFPVKVGVFAADHFHIAYRTVLFHYELYDNPTLHTVFLSSCRIIYMIGYP